jgi:predicted secreted hydrolase
VIRRRAFLSLPLLFALRDVNAVVYAQVDGASISFPRDHGSHPAFRTEWWYVTGWIDGSDGVARGFQVTFFRTRPGVAEDSASAFAPKQILFAHAALADPRDGRLRHDQRAAREGFELAQASETTTDVHIGDWSLALDGDTYRTTIVARDFTLSLSCASAAPPLLQGGAGVSRKGPLPQQASYYYSRPQLVVAGTVERDGAKIDVRGVAWLDHEWSSEYLAPEARGWDWCGIDFDDGAALMAFRMRHRDGADLWAGGALRDARGRTRVFAPSEVRFDALRRWRSPRTSIEYPVSERVSAGDVAVALEPLFDDQELDARASVGTVYWEGAVRATIDGRAAGRGYLELTGYGEALKL